MAVKRTYFSRNFAKLEGYLKKLNIPTDRLWNTKVVVPSLGSKEPQRPPSRRTVQNVLKDGGEIEPTDTNKILLVAVFTQLVPQLLVPLAVEDLESDTFDPAKYMPQKPAIDNDKWNTQAELTKFRDMLLVAGKTVKSKKVAGWVLAIPIEGPKGVFWPRVQLVVDSLGVRFSDLQDALARGGMPPELPLHSRNDSTLKYAQRILTAPGSLSRDQQLIWKVATAIHPPNYGGRSPDQELKMAARFIAKIWDRSIRNAREIHGLAIAPILGKDRLQEAKLSFLLSWLELPLVIQTGTHEPGKVGLFELGRWYQKYLQRSLSQ